MERSGSQKVLRIVSIITIIGGVLTFLVGVLALVGGGAFAGMPAAEVAEAVAESGLEQDELAFVAVAIGILALLTAALYIAEGIFGLRAAKDASKIGPMRVLVIISLVLAVVSIVLNIFEGNFTSSTLINDLVDIAWCCFMYWICNNIKNQANL
jgi:FtsH-binding integral membrane protein